MLPEPIKKFVEKFSALPSIGPRQATRLAFYMRNLGDNALKEFANAITALSSVKTCSACFSAHTNKDKLCEICSNPQRKKNIIAVVEKETDLFSIEKTKKYNGVYMVLGELKKGGSLDNTHKLRLKALKRRIENELGNGLEGSGQAKAKEIILAINPTTYGDINADIIKQELKDHAEKITRLGRGMPTGGEIEFADEDTLAGALDNRKEA